MKVTEKMKEALSHYMRDIPAKDWPKSIEGIRIDGIGQWWIDLTDEQRSEVSNEVIQKQIFDLLVLLSKLPAELEIQTRPKDKRDIAVIYGILQDKSPKLFEFAANILDRSRSEARKRINRPKVPKSAQRSGSILRVVDGAKK